MLKYQYLQEFSSTIARCLIFAKFRANYSAVNYNFPARKSIANLLIYFTLLGVYKQIKYTKKPLTGINLI